MTKPASPMQAHLNLEHHPHDLDQRSSSSHLKEAGSRTLQGPRASDACRSYHPHDLDQRSSSSLLRETGGRTLQGPRTSDAFRSYHPHDLDQRSSSSVQRETGSRTLQGPRTSDAFRSYHPTTWISAAHPVFKEKREAGRYKDLMPWTLLGPTTPTTWISAAHLLLNEPTDATRFFLRRTLGGPGLGSGFVRFGHLPRDLG